MRISCLCLSLLLLAAASFLVAQSPLRGEVRTSADPAAASTVSVNYRSPVDLVLATDGTWLITANETAGSLTLLDTAQGTRLDELTLGGHPAAVVLCRDGNHVAVTCSFSGEVHVVEVRDSGLHLQGTIAVGFEPVGLTVAPNGQTAFVGLVATGEVAELDLVEMKVTRKLKVGAWPRYLTYSPDGSRLAVACSGDGKIAVVDVAAGEVAYSTRVVNAINLGHLTCSNDGKYVYFPYMVYRTNPINPRNIRLGWVLASRIGRVRLDKPAYREAISLDVPGKAMADPHGIGLTSDEHRLVVAASGTHELLVYRRPDLPFIGIGGPSDLIDPALLADDDLFHRIELGGRPMGLAIGADDETVYVANYLKDCVQVIDLPSRKVVREISLGDETAGPDTITPQRLGATIFYDARHSLDQWYSCHTCHYNGGINSKAMDTWNDGSPLTMKTVIPLYHAEQTGPWTWHGWQSTLRDSVQGSFEATMQGKEISDEEADAFMAFLSSNQPPPNPFREPDGSFSDAARRGKSIFESHSAGCAACHSGPHFTDGKIHDVGLGSDEDEYDGYNTPSLLGVYRKVRFLHDGRAKSLEAVLTDHHSPDKVAGERPLSEEELADLVAYLKSL